MSEPVKGSVRSQSTPTWASARDIEMRRAEQEIERLMREVILDYCLSSLPHEH